MYSWLAFHFLKAKQNIQKRGKSVKKKTIITMACAVALGGFVAVGANYVVENSASAPVAMAASNALRSNQHLSVEDGWGNDLQSITWNSKTQSYDIYFLHSVDATNIFGSEGQNWVHTSTKDFVNFTAQKSAIASHGGDNTEGWKSAWTGSVITSNGKIKGTYNGQKVAYFSGLRKRDGKQNIWAVASTDGGQTFTQVLNGGKPVLNADSKDTVNGGNDFRDPSIFTWKGKYYAYVAEGDEIGAYKSDDGVNWRKADEHGASKIGHGTFFRGHSWNGNAPVECPVIKTMRMPNGQTKQVLFFGAKDASHAPAETTGTYYIVGHLDSNGLFAEETDAKRLDQGSDYYGANFSGSTDIDSVNSSIKSMGWVGNWNYTSKGVHADQNANDGFLHTLGSYSTARNLTLNNDKTISQSFVYNKHNTEYVRTMTKDNPKGNNGRLWVDRHDTNGNVYGLYDIPRKSASKVYELNFSSRSGNYFGRIYIDIWQGKDYVRLNYDPSNGWYLVNSYAGELDRSKDEGSRPSSYYYDGLQGHGQGYSAQSGSHSWKNGTLRVITDKTSVEFMFPNGQTYTVARFAQSGVQDFKVFTEDPHNANSLSMTISDIK